jgi:hypothetical protein
MLPISNPARARAALAACALLGERAPQSPPPSSTLDDRRCA